MCRLTHGKGSSLVKRKNSIEKRGFTSGYKEDVNGKQIIQWLSDGSELEDSPMCRASNHFHNPLKDWSSSYMSDEPWWLDLYCFSWSPWYSNVTWGTGYLSPAPNGNKITISNQQMGWDNARTYYYQALTNSLNTDRETYFAKTFQALGQVMHLIEDMAVPAHTRNDFRAHLYFQEAGLSNPVTWFGNNFEWYVKQNPLLVATISAEPIDINNISITRFWDTDVYTGSNPSNSLALGLAEYTNANFFSESSIFAYDSLAPNDPHYFPYPRKSSTNLQSYIDGNELPETVIGEDNIPDTTFYIKKDKDGEVIKRFVTPGYFTNPILTTDPTSPVLSLSFILDDNVYKDYASLLLPRAVGYSAGLLNYFFRGKLDFTIDANDREDGVKGVKISNRSTEDMEGTFSLYYDTADTNRYLLGSWNISLASQGASQVLSFPLPQDYNKYKYTLAFRGRMGTEQDAVAGSRAGWREEWDNGLYGNHTWLYSYIDIIYAVYYPDRGQAMNEVLNGKLIKENIRYAGNKYPRRNETLIMDALTISGRPYCIYNDMLDLYCLSYDFGEEFPMPITKDTWISVKIDEISAYEIPPSQICRDFYSGNDFVAATAWQVIRMGFDNGITLSFTVPGQESVIGSGH
ncbi:MAG: hypothetical protein HY034_07290, partial [Nitrospirae bacterium]|nr:hypothetical protein [Nitrospirota bacterium]